MSSEDILMRERDKGWQASDEDHYFGGEPGTVGWETAPRDALRPVTFLGFPMKHVALALLVLQNSTLIVIMHYSRVVPVLPGQRYLPSTAVLLVEIIKLIVSLSIALYQITKHHPSKPISGLLALLYESVFSSDSWKLIIPAVLYTLQNSLVYVAIGNLNAATFQVTYQLKILTTVLFSIVLLGKRINARQWLALLMLTAGVAIVQISGLDPAKAESIADIKSQISTMLTPAAVNAVGDLEKTTSSLPVTNAEKLATLLKEVTTDPGLHGLSSPIMNASKGILAVIAASLTSGVTGVYFEKVIKDSLGSVSLWTRNVQLSFYSLFPALIIGVLWQDGTKIAQSGFFVGYSWLVWTTIGLQAFGGIMVAVCITYADNIAKNFAASISIVFSCMAAVVFFHSPVTLNFAFGTAIVLLAVYLYHSRDRSTSLPVLPISEDNIVKP